MPRPALHRKPPEKPIKYRSSSRLGITDGRFAEAEEVIGGYWFFLGGSLEEAAALAAQNPCLACGLSYEVRPIESERASAFRLRNETPGKPGDQAG